MRRRFSLFLSVASMFLIAAPAAWAAQPAAQLATFTATPAGAAALGAAVDTLMASSVGKEFPGHLWLQVRLADGADPATHGFFSVYRDTAAREAFTKKLYATPEWKAFTDTYASNAKTVATGRMRVQARWGEAAQSDDYWEAYFVDANDAAAITGALQAYFASATGKQHPGQVWLFSASALGASPVSHIVSVGFSGEAEAEAWRDKSTGTDDWKALMAAFDKHSEYHGAIHVRDMKEWGRPASEVAGN